MCETPRVVMTMGHGDSHECLLWRPKDEEKRLMMVMMMNNSMHA